MAVRPKIKPIVHRDLLNKQIKVNDIVAFAQGGDQYVGSVTKLTPKRVKIRRITQYETTHPIWRQHEYQRPPENVVIVEGMHVTAYILKHSE